MHLMFDMTNKFGFQSCDSVVIVKKSHEMSKNEFDQVQNKQ